MPEPQRADQSKLRELILYIATRMEQENHAGQGRIKLAKLLWLSDFQAYLKLGNSITGTRYISDQFGPSPVDELLAVRDLEDSGSLVQEPGFDQQKLPRAQRPPDTGKFSADELAIVDEILSHYRTWSAKQLVALAHDHPGYKVTAPGEEVPYESVFISTEPPPQAAVELGRRLIHERWGQPT